MKKRSRYRLNISARLGVGGGGWFGYISSVVCVDKRVDGGAVLLELD